VHIYKSKRWVGTWWVVIIMEAYRGIA